MDWINYSPTEKRNERSECQNKDNKKSNRKNYKRKEKTKRLLLSIMLAWFFMLLLLIISVFISFPFFELKEIRILNSLRCLEDKRFREQVNHNYFCLYF